MIRSAFESGFPRDPLFFVTATPAAEAGRDRADAKPESCRTATRRMTESIDTFGRY